MSKQTPLFLYVMICSSSTVVSSFPAPPVASAIASPKPRRNISQSAEFVSAIHVFCTHFSAKWRRTNARAASCSSAGAPSSLSTCMLLGVSVSHVLMVFSLGIIFSPKLHDMLSVPVLAPLAGACDRCESIHPVLRLSRSTVEFVGYRVDVRTWPVHGVSTFFCVPQQKFLF